MTKNNEQNSLPVSQVFPVKPLAHSHTNPFTSSVHSPPFKQGSLAHSSMSARVHKGKGRRFKGKSLLVYPPSNSQPICLAICNK